jgi:hypothetical protein
VFKVGKGEERKAWEMYGDLMCKIMARWPGTTSLRRTGFYVQRNADSLALYALAKYVTTKNGNEYPHLPMIVDKLPGNPVDRNGRELSGVIAEFIQQDDNFFLNTTNDLQAFANNWGVATASTGPGCSDYDAAEEGASAEIADLSMDISGFIPDSAYPQDYIMQRAEWIEELISGNITNGEDGDDGSDDSDSDGGSGSVNSG